MYCIQFRPSARFFQNVNLTSQTTPSATTASPSQHLPQTSNHARFGFQSKEERLAHVEEMKSVLINVTIAKDVVAHFTGGDASATIADTLSPLLYAQKHALPPVTATNVVPAEAFSLQLSVPSTANVNSVIGYVFDYWLELRSRSGRDVGLHNHSLYKKLQVGALPSVRDLRNVPIEVVGVALLEADLSLAICDAAGNILKPLKRVYTPKSNAGSYAPTASQTQELSERCTIQQAAAAILAQQCISTNTMIAQKPLLSALSSFVDKQDGDSTELNKSKNGKSGVTVVPPVSGESSFLPPYFLKIYISDERKSIRRLMLQEVMFREKISAQAFDFLLNFAQPYHNDFLLSDIALRVDWIVYQSHCRHRLHIAEREERWASQQSVVSREEADERKEILLEELEQREFSLGCNHERLMFLACCMASRDMIQQSEQREWDDLQSFLQIGSQQLADFIVARTFVYSFVEVVGPQTVDEYWRESLRWFHDSVKCVIELRGGGL